MRRMLVNPVYVGKLKLNESEMINDKRVRHKEYELVDGKHEALIDNETFNLSLLLSKKVRREKYKSGSFILNNVYCYDGNKMYPSFSRTKGKLKTYYQSKYSYKVIEIDYLEKTVINILLNEMNKLDILNTVDEENNFEERKNFYHQELKKLKNQETKLLKKYLDNNITEETFDSFNKEKIKIFEEKIKELENLQLNRTKQEDNKLILKEYIELLRNTEDREELKKILNIIIAEVRLINDFRPIVITNIF
nr:recombinase family protein [Fusobacterium varium]